MSSKEILIMWLSRANGWFRTKSFSNRASRPAFIPYSYKYFFLWESRDIYTAGLQITVLNASLSIVPLCCQNSGLKTATDSNMYSSPVATSTAKWRLRFSVLMLMADNSHFLRHCVLVKIILEEGEERYREEGETKQKFREMGE